MLGFRNTGNKSFCLLEWVLCGIVESCFPVILLLLNKFRATMCQVIVFSGVCCSSLDHFENWYLL